jgi:hypothetical protein
VLVAHSSRSNHRFEFHKSRQLFIRTHNETRAVAAMRRQQSRLFSRWNPSLTHKPNSNWRCPDYRLLLLIVVDHVGCAFANLKNSDLGDFV